MIDWMDSRKKISCIWQCILLLIGVFAGSLYFSHTSGEELFTYLKSFMEQVSEGVEKRAVLESRILETAILFGLFFFCGLIRFGGIVRSGIVIREGFICGFAVSAFLGCYHAKGFLLLLGMIPSLLLYLTAIFLSGTVSYAYAYREKQEGKYQLLQYISVFLLLMLLFLLAVLTEGYITTVLLKWISSVL